MEFNRNHYFLAGLVLLFLGIQFRMVDSYVLNEHATRFIDEKFGGKANDGDRPRLLAAVGPAPRKTIHPPEWLGWALMSAGAVLILHSLALNRPSG